MTDPAPPITSMSQIALPAPMVAVTAHASDVPPALHSYAYGDLKVDRTVPWYKAPNRYHIAATELFRDGLDIPDIAKSKRCRAELKGNPARIATIEQHLCHVLRVCKRGTFSDDDIRRLLPQIKNAWNQKMYGWLIDKWAERLERADAKRAALEIAAADEAGSPQRVHDLGSADWTTTAPPTPPHTPPPVHQHRPPPPIPDFETRNTGPSLPLPSSTSDMALHMRESLICFLSGLDFDTIAYIHAIRVDTAKNYVLECLLSRSISPEALHVSDIRRVQLEALSTDSHVQKRYEGFTRKWARQIAALQSGLEGATPVAGQARALGGALVSIGSDEGGEHQRGEVVDNGLASPSIGRKRRASQLEQ